MVLILAVRELHSSPTFLLSSIFAPFLTSISISSHLLSSSISLSFRSFLFSYSPLSSPLLFCSTLPSTSSCAFCPKFPFLVFLFYPPFCLLHASNANSIPSGFSLLNIAHKIPPPSVWRWGGLRHCLVCHGFCCLPYRFD